MAPDVNVLSDIYQERINVAVWTREADIALTSAVSALLDQTRGERRWQAALSPEATREWLHQHLPPFSGRDLLLDDITLLVDMFSCLFDLSKIGLRLAILDSAMCPRFHVDHIPCRLVTTYSGPGTQWLAHNAVDRTRLTGAAAESSDAQSGLYQDAADIRQLSAGQVALLKGESWVGNTGAGLVHRSPGIESGTVRLLLTLDFA